MQVDERLKLRGSYEIERYLYGAHGINQGVQVSGRRVREHISVDGELVECHTRPAFAYLNFCALVKESQEDIFTHRQQYRCGLSSDFLSDLAVPFELSPKFERVDALSEIVSGIALGTPSGEVVIKSRDIGLHGRGPFLIYQMHMAYEHCVAESSLQKINSLPQLSDVFSDVAGARVLVSSVGFDRVFAVHADQGIDPLTWQQVKQIASQNCNAGN